MDNSRGRTPFEIRPTDRDYSGLSIAGRYLRQADIERSFFNGVDLTNCVFDAVKLNNTEFSEAKIQRCSFIDCDLNGSDFVDCLLEDSIFERCTFARGEWRDASFRNCRFTQCNFDHTTVTLCTFVRCELDETTIRSAEHRAIYYNIFTRCQFGGLLRDAYFASKNFGIPVTAEHRTLIEAGSKITIDQLCLLNNIGRLRAVDVADAALGLCEALSSGAQRRNSTLTFFSKIARVLTDERRISATSLIYIEQMISDLASAISDQDLFTAAMAAVVEIRSALFSVAREGTSNAQDESSVPRGIVIFFHETYARQQAENFSETLAEVSGAPSDSFHIDKFEGGSTLIELGASGVISLGGLLLALNFVLRQAKITVERWRALKRALKSSGRVVSSSDGLKRVRRRSRAKVPAVMHTGAVAPELAPVRAAVRRMGRTLIEMDEQAEVRILVEYPNRR